jgi:hypothetical protein
VAPFEPLRVLLEGGGVLFDFLECEHEVSQWYRRFEILDVDVGSRAQQPQALLARVQYTTAVHCTSRICRSANSNRQHIADNGHIISSLSSTLSSQQPPPLRPRGAQSRAQNSGR